MAARLSAVFITFLVFSCLAMQFVYAEQFDLLHLKSKKNSSSNTDARRRPHTKGEMNTSVQRILQGFSHTLSKKKGDIKTVVQMNKPKGRNISKRSLPIHIKAIERKKMQLDTPIVINNTPQTIANVALPSGGKQVVEIIVDATQYVTFGFDVTAGRLIFSLSDSPNATHDNWPSFDVSAVNVDNKYIGPFDTSTTFHLFVHISAMGAGNSIDSNTGRMGAELGQKEVYQVQESTTKKNNDMKINLFGISLTVGGLLGSIAGGAGAISLVFVFCCCCCCCPDKIPFRRGCCAEKKETTTPTSVTTLHLDEESNGNTFKFGGSQVASNPFSYDENGGATEQNSLGDRSTKYISDNRNYGHEPVPVRMMSKE